MRSRTLLLNFLLKTIATADPTANRESDTPRGYKKLSWFHVQHREKLAIFMVSNVKFNLSSPLASDWCSHMKGSYGDCVFVYDDLKLRDASSFRCLDLNEHVCGRMYVLLIVSLGNLRSHVTVTLVGVLKYIAVISPSGT